MRTLAKAEDGGIEGREGTREGKCLSFRTGFSSRREGSAMGICPRVLVPDDTDDTEKTRTPVPTFSGC
jgi:hypothetical protein